MVPFLHDLACRLVSYRWPDTLAQVSTVLREQDGWKNNSEQSDLVCHILSNSPFLSEPPGPQARTFSYSKTIAYQNVRKICSVFP